MAARLALHYRAEVAGGHGAYAAVTEDPAGRRVLHRIDDPADALLFGDIRHVLRLSRAGADRLAALEARRPGLGPGLAPDVR